MLDMPRMSAVNWLKDKFFQPVVSPIADDDEFRAYLVSLQYQS